MVNSLSLRISVLLVVAHGMTGAAQATQRLVPSQFTTIQDAIDNASDFDEIIVAPGTYNELIDFLGKPIIVRSDSGSNVTTIDGTALGGSVVTCATSEGADSVLDGFTITGGTGTSVGPVAGGGMYNNVSSPTVVNCVFSGNTAQQGGAVWNNAGNANILNCIFVNNTTTFAGGAIWNFQSNPSITNCLFNANSTVFSGGAIYNATSSPVVVNCTFSGNAGGSVIFSETASVPVVSNCIIWGNSTGTFGGDFFSHVVNYCNVEQVFPGGTGNISSDPLYIDPIGSDGMADTGDEDLRLSGGSPSIDAADNTAVPPDAADLDGDADTAEPVPIDLDGNARFADDPATADTGNGTSPIVDMGAYEFTPTLCVLLGDINVDGVINGADIPGYVRAKLLLSPEPGENQVCADFGMGGIDADTAAFVATLLQ